nr:hypothetical protein [Nevskia sp.]
MRKITANRLDAVAEFGDAVTHRLRIVIEEGIERRDIVAQQRGFVGIECGAQRCQHLGTVDRIGFHEEKDAGGSLELPA